MKVIIINDLANGLKAGLINLPSDIAETLVAKGIAELPKDSEEQSPKLKEGKQIKLKK
jgi:hypothetical protein